MRLNGFEQVVDKNGLKGRELLKLFLNYSNYLGDTVSIGIV